MNTDKEMEGKSYLLNGVTTIKVVGDDKTRLVIEIGGTPSISAHILKQELIDGLVAGYIVDAP